MTAAAQRMWLTTPQDWQTHRSVFVKNEQMMSNVNIILERETHESETYGSTNTTEKQTAYLRSSAIYES